MALYLSRHGCQRILSRRGGMEEQEELQTTSGNFSLAAACWEVQKGHQVTSLLFRMPQLFSNSNRLHLVQAVANAFSMSAYLPWLSIADSSLISCLATSLDLPSLSPPASLLSQRFLLLVFVWCQQQQRRHCCIILAET